MSGEQVAPRSSGGDAHDVEFLHRLFRDSAHRSREEFLGDEGVRVARRHGYADDAGKCAHGRGADPRAYVAALVGCVVFQCGC